MTYPKLGEIVFQTDGSGRPLTGEGIWRVLHVVPDDDYPVTIERVDAGPRNGCVQTTQYRVAPVMDYVVLDDPDEDAPTCWRCGAEQDG